MAKRRLRCKINLLGGASFPESRMAEKDEFFPDRQDTD